MNRKRGIGYGDTSERSLRTVDRAASIHGARIHKVVFDIAKDVYLDVERRLAAAMARD